MLQCSDMWYVQRARGSQQRRRVVRGRRVPPSHQRARLHVQRVLGRAPPRAALALAVLLRVRARVRAALLATVVSLHVLREVVGPHESLIAHRTREPFFPRMCS